MITVIPRKITATSVNGVAVANDGSITLPVDSAPTTNSTNLVTSGGVKTELDALSARIGNAENPAQVWTDVSFTIPTSSWSLSNNKYTATVQSSSILTTSGVFVNYDNLDNAITPIIAEESTGQVTFTTETIPSGTITGTFRIIDSVNGIVPMERGGTGVAATSNDNLLTQLGAASTSALTTGLAGKQNTLTFDSTPTQNSTNPVTSGGVYAANNAQNTQIANLKYNTGIVEDGNTATHTISKGQYVIWKGVLYTADAAIASGTTLAASGGNKNLTAVSGGGMNAINASVDSLNRKMELSAVQATYASGVTTQSLFIRKSGSVVTVNGFVKFNSAPTELTDICTIEAGNRPSDSVRTNAIMAEQAYLLGENAYFTIGSDGVMKVKPKAGNTYTSMYVSCSYHVQR